jgi:hypothetical protein
VLGKRVSSIFLPPYQVPPYRSAFADDPDAIRLERPQPIQSVQRFYQADVEDALIAADSSGDLSILSQLSRGLRRDGVLGGILSSRAGGLTRLPKLLRGSSSVVAAMQNGSDGEVGLFDRIFSPKELSLWIGDGILNGVCLGELVPLPDRLEPVFVRLDVEHLRYQWGDDRWYYYSIGGPVHVVPGDGRWILGMPGGYQNPWQNGLWASLARSYIAKDHAFHFREAYSSALANPARVAYAPQGAGQDQLDSVWHRLLQWGVNTAFGLPAGWEVKLLESNGIGHKVFQETMDASDHEIMVALAGQIVTITGGAGFANADIHATIRSDLIQDDGDWAANALNTQGLRQIVNRMFGSGERGSVAWDTKPPGNLMVEANAITAAMEAIAACNQQLAPYGLKIDAREIATRYRIPTIETTPTAARPVAPDVSGKLPARPSVTPATASVRPINSRLTLKGAA